MDHEQMKLVAMPNSNNDVYVVLAGRVAQRWSGIDVPSDRIVTATWRWDEDGQRPACDYDAASEANLACPYIAHIKFLDSIGLVVAPGCLFVGRASSPMNKLLFVVSDRFEKDPMVFDLMHENSGCVVVDLPYWDWDVIVANSVFNLGHAEEGGVLWRSGLAGRGGVARSWISRLSYGVFHCCEMDPQ
jgi:hypothetical protein